MNIFSLFRLIRVETSLKKAFNEMVYLYRRAAREAQRVIDV